MHAEHFAIAQQLQQLFESKETICFKDSGY